MIIGSSSGGNDSHAAVLWARWRWPETPIIIWHALLDEMDWEQARRRSTLWPIASVASG